MLSERELVAACKVEPQLQPFHGRSASGKEAAAEAAAAVQAAAMAAAMAEVAVAAAAEVLGLPAHPAQPVVLAQGRGQASRAAERTANFADEVATAVVKLEASAPAPVAAGAAQAVPRQLLLGRLAAEHVQPPQWWIPHLECLVCMVAAKTQVPQARG